MLTDDSLLCGNNFESINIVNINKFHSIVESELKESGSINDITKTNNKNIFAIACDKGLWIISKDLNIISTHR